MIDADNIYSWQPTGIQNSFEFLHASFYDGANPLQLFTPKLELFRDDIYNVSVRNPRVFSEFFGLAYPVPNCSAWDLVSNSLLRPAVVLNSGDSPEEVCPVFGKIKDLEFSINKTFFKINRFVIERNRDKNFKEIFDNLKVDITDQKVLVDRFFLVSGFKLLFSNSLKNLCTDLIAALMPVIQKFVQPPASKETSMSFHDIRDDKGVYRKASYRTTVSMPPMGEGVTDFAFADHDYESSPKIGCQKVYICALVISKPQINMYDDATETQVLFGSDADSVLLISKDFLQYDAFHQDPKFLIDFHFHNLNLYTGELTSAELP